MQNKIFERYKDLKSLVINRKEQFDMLIYFMENEAAWLTAPASTKYHLCKESGLLEHSVNVAETMLKIKNAIAPHITNESCVIVALLHDLGKVGYIIATRPLTDENWDMFTPGELIVFKNGDICYSRKGQIESSEIKVLKAIRTAPHKMQIEQLTAILNMSYSNMLKCIESLTTRGYIKQDSTDTVGPQDKKANYYTVRAKRDEIDRII